MISFIVIGKNEGERLIICIKSIIEFIEYNKYESEIIYIDSRSTDNSINTVENIFAMVKTKVLRGKCNAAIARNEGVRLSKGNILFFVDGDMKLNKFFPRIIDNSENLLNPIVTGIRHDIFHDEYGYMINEKINYPNLTKPSIYIKYTGGLFITEKKIWESLGGMDERMRAYEDIDFCMRFFKKYKGKVLLVNRVLAKHYTISYTHHSRQKDLVFSKYFFYKGLLYRKHLLNIYFFPDLIFNDLTFWLLLILLSTTIFYGFIFYNILFYITFSIIRIILRKGKNTKFIFRLFMNIIADINIFFGLIFFHPLTIKRLKNAE